MTSKVDLEINQGSDYSVFFVIRNSADVCHKRRAEQLGGGGGSETAVAIEQMVKFYNGYMATSLDYRDYLNLSANDVLNSIYAFCNSYSGATT